MARLETVTRMAEDRRITWRVAGMLALGRNVLFVVAVIAGLCVFVYSLPLLLALVSAAPIPPYVWPRWSIAVLVLAVALLGRHGLLLVRHARERSTLEAVRQGQPLIAHARAGIPVMLLLLTIAFSVGGLALAGKKAWTGALASMLLVIGFALILFHIAQQILRPGPMLRIDAQGIDHALYGRIAWHEVSAIQLQSQHAQSVLVHTLLLGVRDPMRHLAKAPLLTRWYQRQRLQADPALGVLHLPLNLLDTDAQLIHAAALACRSAHDSIFVQTLHGHSDGADLRVQLRLQDLERQADSIATTLRDLPADADPHEVSALQSRLDAVHDASVDEIQARLKALEQRRSWWNRLPELGVIALLIGWLLFRALR